ncbi:MAG: hypothetical protein ABIF19_14350 [Planctomycetota bacterium]
MVAYPSHMISSITQDLDLSLRMEGFLERVVRAAANALFQPEADRRTQVTVSLDIHKLRRWRTAFFGLVILLAGAVIGGASMPILVLQKLMMPPDEGF